ncbi:MAG: quinone-dependent dihydroorotate dehydrogenase [Pseudomonadota bacterium]
MAQIFDQIGRWAAFQMEPEKAHGLAIAALKSGLLKPRAHIADACLSVDVAGLSFPNPVGVAAGFDKNAEAYQPLLNLGFGFTEVGTLTPRAQVGNPKPRVFRLEADKGVINRLGFNNEGHAPAHAQLLRHRPTGLVGVNIGANKDSEDRVADYVAGIEVFADVASYFTVNVSSPNTPGLRDLQTRENLRVLLDQVGDARARAEAASKRKPPLFLKIAPDVTEGDLDDICQEVLDQGLDGMIVSNTTLSRAGLTADKDEAGGLSGKPLFDRSTIALAKVRQRVGKELALIGVGGIDDAPSALMKIRAGADLIQLYTGIIYQGPHVAQEICTGLQKACQSEGVKRIGDLRDSALDDWARRVLAP